MAAFRLTQAAEADVVAALAWSQTQFGDAARRRYEHLIATALFDIAASPVGVGTIARPELGPDVRSWHLRLSRDRARTADGVVARPRHLLIYRPMSPDLIAIGRLLHDAMELTRHVPALDIWD